VIRQQKHSRKARARQNEILLQEEAIRSAIAAEDPALDKLMRELEDITIIEDAIGDQYEITGQGKIGPDKGKLQIAPIASHGQSDSLETLRSLARGARLERSPMDSLVDHSRRSDSGRLLNAVETQMSQQALNLIGKGGLREDVSSEIKAQRAIPLIQDMDRGYNRKTGAPFGAAGLDAGHIYPHNKYPELSASPENIMYENKYENRTKQDFDDPQKVADLLLSRYIKTIRDSTTTTPGYSAEAIAEMAAGPEIMRLNRKEYLKAKRQGRDIY
jgi:hypothetical protein